MAAMLTVVVAGRNENPPAGFMTQTIADLVKNIRGDTEVIAVLDGAWAIPPIPDDPKVHIIFRGVPIGQRAAVNEGVRVSRSKYIMKTDAHCAFDEGFDVKLVEPYERGELDQRTTTVPRMFNLHAFNWRCGACKAVVYQGGKPAKCEKCSAIDPFVFDPVWQPRRTKLTDFARFDSDLHFQYFGEYKTRPAAQGDLADLMCCVGACWMLPKSFYDEIGGMDEKHGSWGQMGVELACKSWLSGGRQIVNKRTWFAHMFRTQPGFGFPYAISGHDVDRARKHSRRLWMDNTWPQQTRPLSWLLQKFSPVPSWDDAKVAAVSGQGKAFRVELPMESVAPVGSEMPSSAPAVPVAAREASARGIRLSVRTPPKKGLLYYTHNEADPALMHAVQRQLLRCCEAHGIEKIVSVSLRPIDFGDNIVLPFQKGIPTMFKQQLRGLEALADVDVVFFAEHDVLYHPDHFAFEPPRPDVFYYDENVWKIDAADVHQPLFYFAKQTAQLCGARALLLGHYQRRVAKVDADGFSRHMGFEPGCHMPPRGVDAFPAMRWMAPSPQLDIRNTGTNLTKSRWTQAEFRSKNSCLGWTLAEDVPAWPRIFGRFGAFLNEIGGT